MLEMGGSTRDLVGFVLPESGGLVESADPGRPYVLLDADGAVVEPVGVFFGELQACGRSASTVRSYGMDLLRWWRFLAGWVLVWDRVTRVDARDFARWMQVAPKPVRVHWRRRASSSAAAPPVRPSVGVPNPVTGRAAPGAMYSPPPGSRGRLGSAIERGTVPAVGPGPAAAADP
ncbi:site-specific integrase [Streptomyces sp. NPDC002324]